MAYALAQRSFQGRTHQGNWVALALTVKPRTLAAAQQGTCVNRVIRGSRSSWRICFTPQWARPFMDRHRMIDPADDLSPLPALR